ncbi:MAG: SusC/RagA family TonB-linked outer membrane protein [Gemmatimonadaceae bacterium]
MRSPVPKLLAAVALAAAVTRAAPAQEGVPTTYAMAVKTYLPLETVRDGSVRMPKALARQVTVRHADGALVQQVLLEIATQAGLGLSYGGDLAQTATVVSVDLRGATAAEALAAAVRGTPWAVLVNAAGQVAVVPAERRVLATISGRVTDRVNGGGIANATVSLEGTRFGATADDEGRYRIVNVPAGAYTLLARRIGYARARQAVTVSESGTVVADVALDPSVNTLDQVVVTGVPTATSKRTLGNAVSTIDASDLVQKSVVTDVNELLQAKAPGVTVMSSSGTPGTTGTIRIRGIGSLASATDPVVYVDGVRVSSGAAGNFRNSYESPSSTPMMSVRKTGGGQDASLLSAINPEDIESIEVIKGPAAATLYGADAANGVIQIITKKGKPGAQKAQWRAKLQTGRTDWALDRRTSYTTCTADRIAAKLPDGTAAWPGCGGKAPGTVLSSNSLDSPDVLRSGALGDYTLSLSGGGAGYSYFTAADRSVEDGVVRNSDNSRNSGRANFAFYPSDKVNYSATFAYTRSETRFPMGDNGTNLLESAWTFRPGFAMSPGQTAGFAAGSPVQFDIYDNRLRSDRATFGATVNVLPFTWFRNRLTVGGDLTSSLANRYIAPGSLWSPADGQMTQGAPHNNVYTVDYAGTMSSGVPWAQDLTSAFSFGAQYSNRQYRNTIAQGTTYISSVTRDVTLGATPGGWDEYVDVKSLGFFAQEQVGWRDRLYLTGALRVDNSSVFGDDIKQLYYPKLAASYVVSEEPFFKRVGWMDQLRLRAAWGQAGNAPDPFAGIRSYTSQATVDENGNRVPSLVLLNKGNPAVKPERGSEIELGFDATFLRSRLGAEFTFYNKTTKDALMQVPNAPSEGFPGFTYQNLGEINNHGVELALDVSPVLRDAFAWEARLGVSTNKNKLVRFGFLVDTLTFGLTTQNQRHVEGYPLGGFWVHDPVKTASGDYAPGTARFVGSPDPTRELSFRNTFTFFKSLRLYTLLDYKGGFYVTNQTDWRRCAIGTCAEVNDASRSEEERKRLQLDLGVNDALYTQKGDFLKLRDVSLSYTLPASWTRALRTQSAAVTVAGHNLGILWKADYTGLDPEVNFSGANGPTGAFGLARVDYWTMPMTRRISASLDVGF